MCKEQSTKFPLKKDEGSLRHLPLQSLEFQIQIRGFRQWLRVFGFANSTIYYSPVYVKSFFHFLEGFGVKQINQITNNHIRLYIHQLSEKISDRTRQKLSQSYILNHLNAIKLYPVPTKAYLNIVTSYTIDRIEIIDVSGRTIHKLYNPETTLNLTNLSSGIYLYKLQTTDYQKIGKAILVK